MLTAFGTLAGGLGLFLLGVSMITDGLKLAAGNALRDILGRSTRTTTRGLVSGFMLTAMVQSSSAVTMATIGFANAGLLGIHQALSIVLGATVGTTMTSWLVAVVGFQFKISSFAMPLLGIGMVMRLLGASSRTGALGEALAGFGLFFVGIDFLRMAFEGVAAQVDLSTLSPDGLVGLLLYVAIGIVMTMLTQSSSATVALTLTALSSGLMLFPAAAAMVIGATIGTTSTSALSVIGATPNARRVAAGHVCINSFNALIGLLLLAPLLWLSTRDNWLHDYPALTIAVFHTTFNLLGVMLMQPMLARLSRWLQGRFTSRAEELGRPQYIDSNVMVSPSLALDAFVLELQRMAHMMREHATAAFDHHGEPSKLLQQQHDGLRQLAQKVEQAVTKLEMDRLDVAIARQLPEVLRIANYIDEAVAVAHENAESDADVEYLLQTQVREPIVAFKEAVMAQLEKTDLQSPDFSVEAAEEGYQQLREVFRRLKTTLLEAGVRGQVPVLRLNPSIDSLRMMLRTAERSTRVAVRLKELSNAVPAVDSSAQREQEVAAPTEEVS